MLICKTKLKTLLSLLTVALKRAIRERLVKVVIKCGEHS